MVHVMEHKEPCLKPGLTSGERLSEHGARESRELELKVGLERGARVKRELGLQETWLLKQSDKKIKRNHPPLE